MSEKKESPILKAEHLTKMFPVKKRKLIEKQKYVHAAEDVSFEVYPGEVLGIVGESGSGKSTLARTILALTPSTSGQVFYQGEDITDFKVSAGEKRRLRSEIQMIFQDPYASLNPKIKIGKAIAEPMLLHGQASSYAEAKEKIQHLLEVVGLQPAVFDRYPHEFSGGQRQRIGIVRALAVNPKLIFCDESVSALDVSVQAQILNLMNELKREQGTSILFVTHDLGVINQMADDVAVMYCGQVVELAPASTLFDPKSEYSHPYTEGLMLSVPRLDTPAHQRLETIPGSVPHPLDLPKGCKFAPRCKYATDKCREQEPTMTCVSDKQQIRCFYPSKEERHGKAK